MQAKDITFGVEVECYIPEEQMQNFPVGAYHRGLQVRYAPEGWNGQSDGSLGGQLVRDGVTYKAVEIVSPVLAGEEGLTQAFYVVELLREVGAITNEKCGLHVHVGGRDLSPEQVGTIAATFKRYERAYYGLSGRSGIRRWSSTYCKNSGLWGQYNDPSSGLPVDVSHAQDRYCSLNLRNYFYGSKKTLEIRVWSGAVDEVEVISAIMMAVALVAGTTEGILPAGPAVSAETGMKIIAREIETNEAMRIVPEADDIGEFSSFMIGRARHFDKAFKTQQA